MAYVRRTMRRGLSGYMFDRRYGYGLGAASRGWGADAIAAALSPDDPGLGFDAEGAGAGVGATPCRPGLGFDADGGGQGVGRDQFARRTKGYVTGPGRAVAPGATRTNVSDGVARRTTPRLASRGWGADAIALQLSPDDPGLGFAPAIAIAAGKTIGGLIRGSSAPASNAAIDAAAGQIRQGDAGALAFLIREGGFTSNGGWRGAVGKGADYHARDVLNQLIAQGFVVGPTVDINSWRTLPGGGVANNPAQWQLTAPQLRPTMGPATPSGNASVGPGVAQSSNILQDIVAGFLSTPAGRDVQGQVVQGAVNANAQRASQWVAQNLPVILVGTSVLLLVLGRRRN